MKLLKYLLIFTFFTTEVVFANPIIDVHETTYPIYGHSVQELRQQMDRNGPRDETTQFNASTVWYIKWNYQFHEAKDSCKVSQADIYVDIHYHFPEWKNYHAAEISLQNKWNLTMEQLRAHESEHGNNGKRAGMAIENALLTLPSMANCQLLQSQIKINTDLIIQHYQHADLALDTRTRHGVVS